MNISSWESSWKILPYFLSFPLAHISPSFFIFFYFLGLFLFLKSFFCFSCSLSSVLPVVLPLSSTSYNLFLLQSFYIFIFLCPNCFLPSLLLQYFLPCYSLSTSILLSIRPSIFPSILPNFLPSFLRYFPACFLFSFLSSVLPPQPPPTIDQPQTPSLLWFAD